MWTMLPATISIRRTQVNTMRKICPEVMTKAEVRSICFHLKFIPLTFCQTQTTTNAIYKCQMRLIELFSLFIFGWRFHFSTRRCLQQKETSPQSDYIYHISTARIGKSFREISLSGRLFEGRACHESEFARSASTGKPIRCYFIWSKRFHTHKHTHISNGMSTVFVHVLPKQNNTIKMEPTAGRAQTIQFRICCKCFFWQFKLTEFVIIVIRCSIDTSKTETPAEDE